MGTKLMLFPLDASGQVYGIHDENDNHICAGSRETCDRVLGILNQSLHSIDSGELNKEYLIEIFERWLYAAPNK